MVEMTQIESLYYDQLSSLNHQSDWSHSQLFNISEGLTTSELFKISSNFQQISSTPTIFCISGATSHPISHRDHLDSAIHFQQRP